MFSLKEEKRSIKLILAISCLLFFLICIFSIIKYGNSTLMGSLTKFDQDDGKYIRSAWVLLETGKLICTTPTQETVT
jgi:hypothetical protein